MRDSNAAKAKRITACVMGLMMLAIVLFSAFYITAEADHDCCGEDCPICACIQKCENTLRRIGDGAAALFSVIIPVLFALLITAAPAAVIPQETLVSRKIRLNN